jgi:hypothetical protein
MSMRDSLRRRRCLADDGRVGTRRASVQQPHDRCDQSSEKEQPHDCEDQHDHDQRHGRLHSDGGGTAYANPPPAHGKSACTSRCPMRTHGGYARDPSDFANVRAHTL